MCLQSYSRYIVTNTIGKLGTSSSAVKIALFALTFITAGTYYRSPDLDVGTTGNYFVSEYIVWRLLVLKGQSATGADFNLTRELPVVVDRTCAIILTIAKSLEKKY